MAWFNQANKFRPGTRCAICRVEPAVDRDHALYPRPSGKRRSVKWLVFLEHDFNLQPACANCNRWERKADRYQAKFDHVVRMMILKPEEFKEWHESYPGKRLGKWDEVDRMITAYERSK